MKRVDINVDIGEGFPHDEALLEFATSANVCCGEHAGSWDLTLDTIAMCVRKGVRIGCHPGFPDREGFGRRMPLSEQVDKFVGSLLEQVDRLWWAARFAYIKPHGAAYTLLCERPESLVTLLQPLGKEGGVKIFDVHKIGSLSLRFRRPLMVLAGSSYSRGLTKFMYRPIREGFADRHYRKDRTLVPRSEPNAMLEEPAEIAKQVLWLAPRVDSICVHGDTPNCLQFAELVKRTLIDGGYEVGY